MRTPPEPVPAAAFLKGAANVFSATGLTRGLWNADHQHAGPAIALVCRGIEQSAATQGHMHVARITANLLRPLPLGEVQLETGIAYAGRNVGHYEGRLLARGKEVARVTALVYREQSMALPEGLPGHPLPRAPKPVLDSEPIEFPVEDKQLGYADLIEARRATGTFFHGPCAVWFRMRRPLVEGEPPSPYQLVAVAADSGNGISRILSFRRHSFVNSDLTINLLRCPAGEWICLDARTLLASNGCGHAESLLYDEQGYLGRALQTLAVSARS